MEAVKFKDISDIEAFENTPIENRMDVFNTYDLIQKGAAINPDATAISFFLSGDTYDQPMQVTYRELVTHITRTANLYHDLGVGPSEVVSYLLPNLPHTHYMLWGGEAAGNVNPINPLLEPGTIAEICQAAGTKILVALAEFPESDIWEKVMKIRKDLPNLETVIRVMGPGDEKEGIYGYDEIVGRYNGEKLDSNRKIDPQDIASMYLSLIHISEPTRPPSTSRMPSSA